jgi:hypothetical protein
VESFMVGSVLDGRVSVVGVVEGSGLCDDRMEQDMEGDIPLYTREQLTISCKYLKTSVSAYLICFHDDPSHMCTHARTYFYPWRLDES